MAVVGTAQERPDSPDGDFELGKHTFTRTFLVETNSYADGSLVVTAASGIPLLFSTYATANESHPYARCRNLRARRIQPNSLFWEVVARYETPDQASGIGAGGAGGSPGAGGATRREDPSEFDNPLLELPDIAFNDVESTKPITRILNTDTGEYNAPRSSAGEVFDPPAERDDGRLVLTISRNEALSNVHPNLGELYRHAVSTDVFWGRPAGTARVKSILAQRQTKQLPTGTTFAFLRVTYVIEFKADWDVYLLDYGTYQVARRGTGENYRVVQEAFTTADGQPVKKMLDGRGRALPATVRTTTTGDTSNGSPTVTVGPSTTAVRVGDYVYEQLEDSVRIGTTVASKTAAVFVLSAPATRTNENNVTFRLLSEVVTTGNPTIASHTLTSVASTAGVGIGDALSGPGIPEGATVVSTTVNTIVMDRAATSTSTGTNVTARSERTVAGKATFGSTTVTTGGVTTGVRLGDRVTGSGVPDDTYVLAVTATDFTLSHNATATASAVALTLERAPDPVFVRLRPYHRLPFADLALPNSFTEAR